jgi:hypothetical protein
LNTAPGILSVSTANDRATNNAQNVKVKNDRNENKRGKMNKRTKQKEQQKELEQEEKNEKKERKKKQSKPVNKTTNIRYRNHTGASHAADHAHKAPRA